jgi:hypothetical protein
MGCEIWDMIRSVDLMGLGQEFGDRMARMESGSSNLRND